MPDHQPLEPKFTVAQICENLRISSRTLRRRLAENPTIRPLKAGHHLLFTRREIAQLEEALRQRYAQSADKVPLPRPAEVALRRQMRLRATQRLAAQVRAEGEVGRD